MNILVYMTSNLSKSDIVFANLYTLQWHMGIVVCQITHIPIIFSTAFSEKCQKDNKFHIIVSVMEIHRSPEGSPHK